VKRAMDKLDTATDVSVEDLPWLRGDVTWDEALARRAVIWLSLKVNKSILRLCEEDYTKHGLSGLVKKYGKLSILNREVFKHLQSTITGWPGGAPPARFTDMTIDERREELKISGVFGNTMREPQDYMFDSFNSSNRAANSHVTGSEYPKRVLIFSPHPDDDVISMGGTLLRLVEQGHQVHVAYQTSGNYAVWDDDVKRFINFANRLSETFQLDSTALGNLEEEVETFYEAKKPGQSDSPTMLKIKGIIRETEARAAARFCGVHRENIHFLNLPFYESGKEKKNPMGEADIIIIEKLLNTIKPHQIYCAGDLLDPHGTHRVCLSAIVAALERVKEAMWFVTGQTQVWMYRGAWQEFPPHEITMAVPMSPDELLQKRYAIFKHQSQKDPPPFAGNDKREFWQRSEARNRETARLYDRLGLTEYEGMEAFVLFDIHDETSPFKV